MHPVFWYRVPALLKHWFDKVLAYGWAYGEGGTALHGKHCLWVPTTGGDERDFAPSGIHAPSVRRLRARRSSRPRASAACAGSRPTSCTTPIAIDDARSPGTSRR